MELLQKKLNKSLTLLAKTSFSIFIFIVLSKIFTYLHKIFIARYFGPEIYGLFSLALMVSSWFVAFSSFGLSNGLLRYLSFYRGKKENNKINYLFNFSIKVLFISSILAGIILFFSSEFISLTFFHNSNLIIFLKIFSISIPLCTLSSIFFSTIVAFEKIKQHSFISEVFQNFIILVLLFFFLFLGFNTNAIIFSYVLGIAFAFFLSYLYCKYKIPQLFLKNNLENKIKTKITKNLFSYSWPFLFLGFVHTVFLWADLSILGYFRPILEVGLYSAAIPIARLLSFFPDIFLRLFFPLAIKEFSKKNLLFVKELSKQIEKWIFIIVLPFFLLLFLFPAQLINLLFGSEYIAAENALRFLSIGFLFYSLSIIFYNLIAMAGKSKLFFWDILIISILNIILNLFLIPKYGINGAAIATMIGHLVLFLVLLYQTNSCVSIIPLRRKMLKIILVTIIPVSLSFYLNQFIPSTLLSILLQAIFFLLCYTLIILITGCLDNNDMAVIKAIKKKFFKNEK